MSTATLLTQLETARTSIITALAAGETVVEYEINGRRVRRESKRDLMETLSLLETMISQYQARINGRNRNYAKLVRDIV